MKRFELILVGLIVAVGAFLRLYHLPDTLMFQGDQGRDAIIAKNILKERDVALIGPVTSVGNMYLGPLYYYFMVPFLAMTYPNPVGPAYGVALVNVLTIFLIYWVGKKVSNSFAGIVAAAIFAFMPASVVYSRFSWNPNIAPFFSILIYYLIYLWWKDRSPQKFLIIAVLTGLLAQTHYVSLTAIAVIGFLWMYKLIEKRKIYISIRELIVACIGFGLTTVPLIIFNFRHDNLIVDQFIKFFTSSEKHISFTSFMEQVGLICIKTEYLLSSILHQPGLFKWDRWVLILNVSLIAFMLFKKKRFAKLPIGLSALWMAMAILGTSIYSHTTYLHYLTYSLPIAALLWGQLLGFVFNNQRILGLILSFMVLGICISGLSAIRWNGHGTKVLQTAVYTALPEIDPPYNLVLLSDDKDYKGMNYRYFFDVSNKKPQNPDDYGQLQTLVLIDETLIENPRAVPIYEIEAAKDFGLEKKMMIPNGPWVYILKKG